jgi:hypothetical protein
MTGIVLLVTAAAAVVLLCPATVLANPPTHTTQHVDTAYVLAPGELCAFSVAVHSVGDNDFTTFDDGSFIAHSSFSDTYTNLDTRSVLYVRSAYTGHVEHSAFTIGHDTGAFLQLRDANGKLLAQDSGQLAFDFSPGAPGITKVTPNAEAAITQDVICAALS